MTVRAHAGCAVARTLAFALAALTTLACASSPGPTPRTYSPWAPSQAPATPDAAPPVARRVSILFELDGRPFPLPLVHGKVKGEPTWMLLDTGANSHVMAGWLARKVGLAVEAHGDVGTDHTGREIPTSRVEHAGVAIDGWGELADGPMLVTEIPEPVAKLGIGMFLSPQGLGQGAAVVLDLAGRQMYLASYAEAERQIAGRGSALSPAGGVACVDSESPVRGLAYVIPAEVEGRKVTLLVDSGAERTDLLVDTPAAAALASRSVANKDPLYAASGRIRTRMVHGARVKVGEWSGPVDIDLIPGTADAFCPREGVLSMDVLASCVLVLGPGRMLGRCTP